MADKITLKTKDICEALEISRHQFRAWTDALKPYCHRETRERSASRYDSADLLYFALISHIIERFGVSLPYIAHFSEELYSCVREPQGLTSPPFLFISNQGSSCTRLSINKVSSEGIVVDIKPAQTLVYEFLGLSNQQTQLQLGLMKVN